MWSQRLALIAVAASVVITAGSLRAATGASSVVGTWKLVSDQQVRPDGTATDLYGAHPLGQLMYDADGHMSVHLLKSDLPKCGTQDRRQCPDAAARAAFDNYLGYWGRYTISSDGKSITHHIQGASAADWIGVAQERSFQLAGNRLTLTTPLMMIGGVQSKSVLIWERE